MTQDLGTVRLRIVAEAHQARSAALHRAFGDLLRLPGRALTALRRLRIVRSLASTRRG